MSTIDKLAISGIRSFPPNAENPATIEFYKPLTLIVGPNGAGKTTILECLKTVTTGEFPPYTSSGKSFLHDPRCVNMTTVRAQIKLKFRSAAGGHFIAIRSYEASRKGSVTQPSLKTLDSTLTFNDPETGEVQALSFRIKDIDLILAEKMGVNKAILENVVFVHQEDSTWPLSDPATIKKKFDDIFSATKYTKVLETMKKLRNEKVVDVKVGKE